MTKSVKNTKIPEVEQSKDCLPLQGVWGILVLFVIASIAYSTYMVALGTQGLTPKVMLIPQTAFAVIVALYKFSKS